VLFGGKLSVNGEAVGPAPEGDALGPFLTERFGIAPGALDRIR